MAQHEEKANALIAKAEKKLNSFSLFGKSGKYEEAEDMYKQAANLLKLAKKWQEAGQCFVKVAEFNIRSQSMHEAGSTFIEAANCFKKTSSADAIDCYKRAILITTENGKFSQAAKYHKEIAEMCESDMNFAEALENYQSAAEFYQGEEATSSANSCLLKVAMLSAQQEQYERAIEVYEQVASAALDQPLLKYSVKDYFLHAGLCHMCLNDQVGARRAVDRYKDMDASFCDTRECKLLEDVLQAWEDGDVDAFTNTVAEFDSITKLDAWKTSVLLKVKNNLKGSSDFT